jgi:hypothetical protein
LPVVIIATSLLPADRPVGLSLITSASSVARALAMARLAAFFCAATE